MLDSDNYFIKEGYTFALEVNSLAKGRKELSYQSDVYLLAYQLAKKFDSKYVIDLGCSKGEQLKKLNKSFDLIGIDSKEYSEEFQEKYPDVIYLEHDFQSSEELSIPKEYLKDSIVICTDLIERLNDPNNLLTKLKEMMDDAALALIMTPERDLLRGVDDFGPPADKTHVREWNQQEFNKLLDYFDFNIEFVGLTSEDTEIEDKNNILAIVANNELTVTLESKDDFKVVAIMTVFNEEDIIYHSIKKLLDQDIYVYIIDNWSTDDSFEIIKGFKEDSNFLGFERFPHSKPSSSFNLIKLLQRVEEVTKTIEADWFIHQDADEIRMAPWNLSLKEAIIYVDTLGYNAINHTVVNFHPVDDQFTQGNHEEDLRYFNFGRLQGDSFQIKAWKNTGQKISLAIHGGHVVGFKGRKVCPYKFVNKHYPIRSQKQGELKIFKYRKPRWNKKEREKGWHLHYDHIKEDHCFIKDADKLNKYISDEDFRSRYLVEIISGLGT
ncbi:methyltransferase domain-containing protein [Orenia marismortui]|uniref:Glycosyl transferase family 2 n=1 Tax=Orenia marismortui TaxID=46469 RepID=A0A4R8GZQ2_9FIRM|nr:methyltransferase domain-containing protein [Orenia marismortui]TDX52355.1 glycosyl transferase family 2 [Orenia marismortui]